MLERGKEQGELFLDHFFLLTKASVATVPAEALLERYRKRGATEKDFGGWKQTLAVSLSSSPRLKVHYRGRQVQMPYTEPDSFAAHEVRLLLSLIAANLLYAASGLLERGETARLGRERFRQLFLKTGRSRGAERAPHYLRDRVVTGRGVATLRTGAESDVPGPRLARSPGLPTPAA